MNPQKKAFVVGLILVGGFLLALPFRHGGDEDSRTAATAAEGQLWLSKSSLNKSSLNEEDGNQETEQPGVRRVNLKSPQNELTSRELTGDLSQYANDALRDGNYGSTSTPQGLLNGELEPVQRFPVPARNHQLELPRDSIDLQGTANPQGGLAKPDHNAHVNEQADIPRVNFARDNSPRDVVAIERPANARKQNDGSRTQASPRPPTQPRTAKTRTVRHTVRDGDTLQSLARRYLGDQRRGLEIYKANRSLLTNPSALPIGEELIIVVRK